MGASVHGMDTIMEPLELQPIFSPWHPWVHPSMGRTQQWTH